MEKGKPCLSVILPVYNAEKFLCDALDSLCTQTFADFELIAVNDGSTDSSQQILARYSDQDDRIKVINQENHGLIYALNKACHDATTPYLVRMDADDICLPERFEKQLTYMEQHPECVALGGRVTLIDDEGYKIMDMGTHLTHEEIDREHIHGRGGAIIHPAAIIRTEAWKKIGGYQKEFKHAEDLDLFLRLAEVGELANLDTLVLYYRQHLESVGYSHREAQFLLAQKAVRAAVERRKLKIAYHMQMKPKKNVTAKDSYLKWAWWAYGADNHKTANKYALRTLLASPLSATSWRLVMVLLRDSFKRKFSFRR